MKIFYAVQATGNGHISRAMELLPYLRQYGKVDIFLSGDNSHLKINAPVKFRSKGINLYYNCRGGLDYWQMVRSIRLLQIRDEIRELPVEKYDIVLNDFDHITSAACARKNVPSIHFGHQASFQSLSVPRPAKRNAMGEWLLRNYVKATHHVGLHFNSYHPSIFGAVVKKKILEAEPLDHGHITVYLPSYCETQLRETFFSIPDLRFEIFSGETSNPRVEKNIRFIPVDNESFTTSMINCKGIITGGGFETPAEALHLGKPLIVIPIRGQYEQQCNAAALKLMGIPVLEDLVKVPELILNGWLQASPPGSIDYSLTIPKCLSHIFSLDLQAHKEFYRELVQS